MKQDTLYVCRTSTPTVFYVIKDGKKHVYSENEIRKMSFRNVVIEEYMNYKEVMELLKSWEKS